MNNLTIIYYTSNVIKEKFFQFTKNALLEAAQDTPIISVSQKPIDLGENICVGNIGRSNLNIYKQALIGAKKATTKYIAMAEDDTLYTQDHFEHRSEVFSYNMNKWSLFSWSKPPIFSNRGRKTLNALICPKELFIKAMEERFNLYPDESKIPMCYWGEPGRNVYERHLGVSEQPFEEFQSKTPIVMFCHPASLNYEKQGTRKILGNDRSYVLPKWGKAEDIIKILF